MSDYITKQTLHKYLERLEEQALPNSNDRRHAQYVRYTSKFLSHFGKEFAVLTGSTSVNLKLRWSKDGGDADILLCSGKLEIPVGDLEFRDDNPCFLRVKVAKSNVSPRISLIEDKYLPGDILRRVDPELFTMLRGIFLMVTCSTSYVPGRQTEVTTTGEESKVGLQRVEYRDLKIHGQIVQKRRQYNKILLLKRDRDFKKYLDERRKDVPSHKQDIDALEQLLKFVADSKIPGSSGEHGGQWQHFAQVVKLVLQRRKEGFSTQSDEDPMDNDGCGDNSAYDNDLDSEEDMSTICKRTDEDGQTGIKRKRDDDDVPKGAVRATCAEKTSKDYVPALRIIGTLPLLLDWRNRPHRWLKEADVDEIYNMDVYIVARYAPVNPSRKDFCLSFTHAEKKLAECLLPAQRKITLTLKAYLKGLIKKRHEAEGHELKLKTFHLMTVVYQVSDITDPNIWSNDNILEGLTIVLTFLEQALREEKLLHYFVASNLFDGFENKDYNLLRNCVREILNDPIGSIKHFFDLDDNLPAEVWLTEEEVLSLENMSDDGGLAREVDRMEEAILEFQRGFNDGPRDEQGNAPIQAALATVGQIFLEEEATQRLREAEEQQQLPPGLGQVLQPMIPGLSQLLGGIIANPEGQALVGTLGQLLGNSSRSRDERRRLEEELKYRATSYFSGRPG